MHMDYANYTPYILLYSGVFSSSSATFRVPVTFTGLLLATTIIQAPASSCSSSVNACFGEEEHDVLGGR